MPPKKSERPEEGALKGFLATLGQDLTRADQADIAAKGRVHSRRLTRVEYEHTLHDLLGIDIPLTIVHSHYRLVIQPILDFIEKMELEKNPEDYITVLIPEFETRKWWHRFLHNQTGWVLRTKLILRDDVIVTTIPYHLKK